MTIKKKLVEIITITGPMEEAVKATAYAKKRQLIYVTISHVKVNGGLDTTRFRMVARKQHKYQPLRKRR